MKIYRSSVYWMILQEKKKEWHDPTFKTNSSKSFFANLQRVSFNE